MQKHRPESTQKTMVKKRARDYIDSDSNKSDEEAQQLQNFDPENEEGFGGTHNHVRARSKTDDAEARQHYTLASTFSIGHKRRVALPIDEPDFMEGKYAGIKVNKSELGYQSAEENFDGQLMNEDMEEDRLEFQDPAQVPSNTEWEASLLESEAFHLQMVAQKQNDDRQRGIQVREQLKNWQNVLDLRVKLQPLLTAVQRIPESTTYRALLDDEQVKQHKNAAHNTLSTLCDTLTTAFSHSSNAVDLELRLAQADANLGEFWKSSLDFWHQKVSLTTIDGARKQLKVINQSLWSQVESASRDHERLFKRAFTRRSAVPVIGESPDVCFDDSDFFSILVRDWIGNQQGSGETTISGINVTRIKQHRNGVDPRASKGRKLRFDVQDKLVNYMVPVRDATRWPDEKIDAFFSSVFPNTVEAEQ